MRFRQRHAHQSVVDYVTAVLTNTGWTSATPPLGAPEMTILDYEPQTAGSIVPAQSVCISLGDQDSRGTFDLGGGLFEVRYPVFIDIYPSDESIGISIAEDIADALIEHYIPLYDYTHDAPAATGNSMEITNVLVQPIPGGTKVDKRPWRVVKATAILQYTPPAA